MPQPSAEQARKLKPAADDKVCAAGPTGADRPAGTARGANAELGEYCVDREDAVATAMTTTTGMECLSWLDAVGRSSYAEERIIGPLDRAMMSASGNPSFDAPDFSSADGLVTAVAQDVATGQVLMVAHMNRAAWEETLASGQAVYYSRTRRRLWRKGEESGNIQRVCAIYVDCDGDAVLVKVEQEGGAACHEGYASCFFRQMTAEGLKIVSERVFDPKQVYGKSE